MQNKKDDVKVNKNVEFYQGLRISEPFGAAVDTIINRWSLNYRLLERHHGFIQWLFPNSYQSRFNPLSQPISQE